MQDVRFQYFMTLRPPVRTWFTIGSFFKVLAMADASVILISAVMAGWMCRGASPTHPADFEIGAVTTLLFAIVARKRGLYRVNRLTMFARFAPSLLALTLGSSVAATLVLSPVAPTAGWPSSVLTMFYASSTVGVLIERATAALLLRRALEAGAVSGRPVVMIGEANEMAGVSAGSLLDHGIGEIARFELTGRGADLTHEDRDLVSRAVELARAAQAHEFGLILNWRREAALEEILTLLCVSPLPVRLYPDLRTRNVLHKHRGHELDLAVEVQRAPLRRGERAAKRVFDVALAVLAAVLLSPLLIAAAIAIKLESRGPILFFQRRRGFDNAVFTICKFRTMSVLEDGDLIEQAKRSDRRITRIGRVLRKTSVDELPQLWNVIKGEMSLVGPRPHALAHDREYSSKIVEYAKRRRVKPGLTGAAQVRGLRGETPTLEQMAGRVAWDLWYINNWSIFLDIRIVAQTLIALAAHEAF